MIVGTNLRMDKGISKDIFPLIISSICLFGVLHLEWKILNFESEQFVQRKADRKARFEESKPEPSLYEPAGRLRKKRSPYTIQSVRQMVREEIYEIMEGEFCTSKDKLCMKGSRGATGSPGIPGIKGERGQQGPHGVIGERGYPGPVGFPGVKGEKGATGNKGNPGDAGKSISAPIITSPPVTLVINKTQDAALHCDVTATPDAEVTWSKVNSSLPIGRYTQGSDNKLSIRNVQSMDNGVYACTARNVLGTVKILSKIEVQVKPAFSLKPRSSIIEVGKTVQMACGASGQPTPRIWWAKRSTKGSPPILLPSRYEHLIISNVTKDDQGTYMCHAENGLGKIFTSAQLTVFTRLEFIIFPPKAVMSVLGGRLELHCQAQAEFPPLVTWMMEGNSIMPYGIIIYPNGTLMISKVSRSHQGSYKCMATSQISSIETSVNVIIKYPESCSIISKFVTRISGSYVIDPDGAGGVDPFVVYCNMTARDKIGVTVISHDSEDRIIVDGCEPKGCYSRQIQYTGASLRQLTSLTRVSAKCEQFIKYECYNTWFLGEGYAWWISRDGVKMTHWGGAPVGSGKCACGITNSCDGGWKCNCDYLERRWKEDSGFLMDKSVLPVKELRFGDTGVSAEQGFHTLGKFKCYGIA